MLIRKIRNGLEFENDLVIAEDIGNVCLRNRFALVIDRQFFLCFKGNVARVEFAFHALLVDFLMPAVPHMFVHLEDCALNGVDLVLEKKLIVHEASIAQLSHKHQDFRVSS